MRFCRLNPIDALKRYQYLAVLCNDITTNKECTLYSNLGKQQLDVFSMAYINQKDTCDDKYHSKTVNKEYLESIYISDIENNSENASVFAEYILCTMKDNPDIEEFIRDMLSSNKETSAWMIVDFINEALSITLDDILSTHQTTKDCKFDLVNAKLIRNFNKSEYCSKISHDENINPNNEMLNIEISIKKKYYCRNDYWRNENPNKNEYGYYWDYVEKEVVQSLEKSIKSIPFEELSIKNIQSIIKNIVQEYVKASIKVVKFGAEILISASI